jgi:8-oxo-dGTP pyrophosphatase MutT (NUDIX family)
MTQQSDGANPWQTLSKKVVYKSPWMVVREDKVITPGGTHGIYSVIEGGDGVIVIAETDDQKIHLIESYCYPLQDWNWELPTGGMSAGETPLECAKKELREEVGLTAERWTELGKVRSSFNGSMNDRQHIFLAQAVRQGDNEREPGEAIRTVKMVPQAELWAMVRAGGLQDGQTLMALLYYKLWRENNSAADII